MTELSAARLSASPIYQRLSKRLLQVSQPWFVIAPAVKTLAVRWLTNLLGTRGMNRSLSLEEAQARFFEGKLEMIEQLSDFPLEIVDQIIVDDAVDAARRQHVVEVTHDGEIIRIMLAQLRLIVAEIRTSVELLYVIGEAAVHRITPRV